ncbi:alternative ribosome rescue aminoacyl-tRNA hydrolase ArfB [Carboxylicivirga marina]|uniref:Aminoacyl-tRNA hydrolase n=1 Tax=Carboxylicivirga marina TaxID=2800988 RepID=A0ABS1HND2_9BACT|nr:alternative ribosome rescue aminoacyl-tRNA hydrolase ArfB [Carboxylicivirga marina]MBK3519188.1 aminoacyl-tRNA hydrolase [Carboxylicivirga marina]
MTYNRDLRSELKFITARSSGPGGQNVNKVNSKVILRFNISDSSILSVHEKQLLINRLKHRLTIDNELILSCQESRSQLQNKNIVINLFDQIISKALTPIKKRVKTKRTRASIEKRLSSKKLHSIKKANRRSKDF